MATKNTQEKSISKLALSTIRSLLAKTAQDINARDRARAAADNLFTRKHEAKSRKLYTVLVRESTRLDVTFKRAGGMVREGLGLDYTKDKQAYDRYASLLREAKKLAVENGLIEPSKPSAPRKHTQKERQAYLRGVDAMCRALPANATVTYNVTTFSTRIQFAR